MSRAHRTYLKGYEEGIALGQTELEDHYSVLTTGNHKLLGMMINPWLMQVNRNHMQIWPQTRLS